MPHRLSASLLTALTTIGVLAACSSSPESPELVPITELSVGDCFSADAELTVATLAASCEAPHLYEVLAMAPSAVADSFPGDEALAVEADALCADAFTALGRDAVAGIAPLHLVPSEASWLEGDRQLVCLIASTAGTELTGSRIPTAS